MIVTRLISNLPGDPRDAARFYGDVLGLDRLMDHGWIATFGSTRAMAVQVSVALEGGSGTPLPDLSVEVDDLDEALARVVAAGFPVEYGPSDEPWGVRRFFTRDPFGNVINILTHLSAGHASA